MNGTRNTIVFAAALLFSPVFAHADTLTTSGTTNVSVTPMNMYSYCTGDPICGGPNILPHSQTDTANFDITLAGLALPQGTSLTSANLLVSGLDLGSFTQIDDLSTGFNPDSWNVNTGAGNFTSITVGSYSLALSGTDGVFIISDPNILAGLAAGDAIDIQGYAAVTTSPVSGMGFNFPVLSFDEFGNITGEATFFGSTPVFDTQFYSPTAELDGVFATTTPEPASLLLLAIGFGVLFGLKVVTTQAQS